MKHIFILKENTDKQFINKVIECMQGYDYVFRFTKTLDDARDIAYEYKDELVRLYAVGGDGFVHKVANGMVHTNNELVVIPLGTGNDFARSIYSKLDPITILKNSLSLKAKYIHLIKCNDIYCINVCCCALDALIANKVHLAKNPYIPKSLHYISQILKEIFILPSYNLTIKHNNELLFDGLVTIGAFCNSKYFGGGFYIGYNSDLSKNYIDINYVEAISKKELISYGPKLLSGKLNKTKKYHNLKLEKATFIASQPINIDGEIFDEGKYDLSIVKNAIKVVY